MTRGQKLIALWLRQRKLKTPGKWGALTVMPTSDDYAELARRIDSFAKRVKIGAA